MEHQFRAIYKSVRTEGTTEIQCCNNCLSVKVIFSNFDDSEVTYSEVVTDPFVCNKVTTMEKAYKETLKALGPPKGPQVGPDGFVYADGD